MSDTVGPAIRLENVSKSYGPPGRSTKVIHELSLAIPQGEFVSMMGPSGSGKTTLLNLIAGLDTPDTGVVWIHDTKLNGLKDWQLADLRLKTLGFVFQAFNLIPALNVQENVSWPLEFSGYRKAEVRSRTEAALARVGMGEVPKRFPAELSGGEQQRVAIARAIATRPSILLADEPTGNLDSQTGQSILDLLRELNRTDGVTIVMVTHNVFAATYGHRTLELRDGEIVRDVLAPSVTELTSLPGEVFSNLPDQSA